MTRVHLLAGDDRNAPAGGLRNRPHALDSGDAELLQIGPNASGAQSGPEQARFVSSAVCHEGAGQGGIVSVTDFLYPHVGCRPARSAVIAGKFAERSFG